MIEEGIKFNSQEEEEIMNSEHSELNIEEDNEMKTSCEHEPRETSKKKLKLRIRDYSQQSEDNNCSENSLNYKNFDEDLKDFYADLNISPYDNSNSFDSLSEIDFNMIYKI